MKHLKNWKHLKENNKINELDGILDDASDIKKYVVFSFNYPYDFIEKIWGGTYLEKHLQDKFDMLYKKYDSRAVMNVFYTELDLENQKKLEDFILKYSKNE